MRFFADGPSIPEELLDERDGGNVVFFCGAGVSVGSGLPDFKQLTQAVLDELDTPSHAQSAMQFNKQDGDLLLDQVFFSLQREYGPACIERVVSRVLRRPARPTFEQHKTILELSRTETGSPLVVTTNFDRLFEDALASMDEGVDENEPLPGAEYYVGPELPQFERNPHPTGVVYLHGRLGEPGNSRRKRTSLLLSSSDFGRAYLAEGWAARFVSDLCQTRIVLLVGYSANDPPISYLLQGLDSMRSGAERRIYAFDASTAEDVVQWQRKGVTPIVYSRTSDHSGLWNTLGAWANRAKDVDRWRDDVCRMAKRGPRALEPFERGQVASLVRTIAGAQAFVDFADSQPAEWLCVFDRSIRCGRNEPPSPAARGNVPSTGYFLDDDVSNESTSGQAALDLLHQLPSVDEASGINGLKGAGQTRLPRRLQHLTKWIAGALHEPGVAWWVAGCAAIHPDLIARIQWFHASRGVNLGSSLCRAWSLLLEARVGTRDEGMWHEVGVRIGTEGWTPSVLRAFEVVTQPYIKATRPSTKWPAVAEVDRNASDVMQVARFELKFPRLDLVPYSDLPSDILPQVFTIALRGLERAASLLNDIGDRFFHTTTLIPESKPGEPYHDDADRYLLGVGSLLDRMARQHASLVGLQLRRWIQDARGVFDKVRIYGWMRTQIFSTAEVVSELLAMSDDRFWETEHRRELLHVLRLRWSDLDEETRPRLEEKILRGRPIWEGEEESDHRRLRSFGSAQVLGWLESHQCALSQRALDGARALQSNVPDWKDEWVASADATHDGRGDVVRIVDDPRSLLGLPLADIVRVAAQHTVQEHASFTDREPFRGLVKQRPLRAVAALSYEARHQRYPTERWSDVLAVWPEDTSPRLQRLLAHRLVRLPQSTVLELRDYAPHWFQRQVPRLAVAHYREVLVLWDGLAEHFYAGAQRDPAVSGSSRGAGFSGGERIMHSRRTAECAEGSPLAILVRTLIETLKAVTPTAGTAAQDDFRRRLERLLGVAGDGSDYVVCMCTEYIRSLDELDPEWTERYVVPWFDPLGPKAEPAWSGYFHPREYGRLRRELFVALKPHLLRAFEHASEWHWDQSPLVSLSSLLVHMCHAGFVTTDEARSALRMAGDEGRTMAADRLGQMFKPGGSPFVKTFIAEAWPRELACRSERVTREFVDLAWKAGGEFADVVDLLCDVVGPIDHLVLPHAEGGAPLSEFAKSFPDKLLTFLDQVVPNNPRVAPHGLGIALRAIGEEAPRLRQDPAWRRLNGLVHH